MFSNQHNNLIQVLNSEESNNFSAVEIFQNKQQSINNQSVLENSQHFVDSGSVSNSQGQQIHLSKTQNNYLFNYKSDENAAQGISQLSNQVSIIFNDSNNMFKNINQKVGDINDQNIKLFEQFQAFQENSQGISKQQNEQFLQFRQAQIQQTKLEETIEELQLSLNLHLKENKQFQTNTNNQLLQMAQQNQFFDMKIKEFTVINENQDLTVNKVEEKLNSKIQIYEGNMKENFNDFNSQINKKIEQNLISFKQLEQIIDIQKTSNNQVIQNQAQMEERLQIQEKHIQLILKKNEELNEKLILKNLQFAEMKESFESFKIQQQEIIQYLKQQLSNFRNKIEANQFEQSSLTKTSQVNKINEQADNNQNQNHEDKIFKLMYEIIESQNKCIVQSSQIQQPYFYHQKPFQNRYQNKYISTYKSNNNAQNGSNQKYNRKQNKLNPVQHSSSNRSSQNQTLSYKQNTNNKIDIKTQNKQSAKSYLNYSKQQLSNTSAEELATQSQIINQQNTVSDITSYQKVSNEILKEKDSTSQQVSSKKPQKIKQYLAKLKSNSPQKQNQAQQDINQLSQQNLNSKVQIANQQLKIDDDSTRTYICGCNTDKTFKNFLSLREHFYSKHSGSPPKNSSHDMKGCLIEVNNGSN